MKELKPYLKRKNKLYFRKGKKKMAVERESLGCYKFSGDVISGEIDLRSFNPLLNTKIQIKVYK